MAGRDIRPENRDNLEPVDIVWSVRPPELEDAAE